MKIKKLILIILLIIAQLPFIVKAQTFQYGVNLAGAEFGTNLPGVFNTDYTYPNTDELDYYKLKGLVLVRLPFSWERIQPTLNGTLDAAELNRLKTFVQNAAARNIDVLLDLHNYCRYSINGTEQIIGSNNLSIANVKDVWTRLANEFKNDTNIWGYGIMNEPHDLLSNTSWFSIAQEIITGIRNVDTETTIIVGGDSWSSAERWPNESDNLKNLVDVSDKLIYEAHVYFDSDASGQYLNSYDDDQITPNTGVDRVQPFVNWLQQNNLRGFIGEYGIPDNDTRWLTTLDNFLNHLKNNCINGTYWAGGPWWGTNFMAIDPVGTNGESDPVNGTERPQMSILENFSVANGNCTNVLAIDNFSDRNTNVLLYPNPASKQITIRYTASNFSIRIITILGQEKARFFNISNSKIIDLEQYTSGIYFVQLKDTQNQLIGTYKMIKQ